MATHTLSIKSIVMRRVAYSFGLRILTNRAFLPGIFFGYSAMTLRELVFVRKVVESFLASEVGQLPITIMNILQGADIASLLALLVMLASVFLFCRFLAFRTPLVYQGQRVV